VRDSVKLTYLWRQLIMKKKITLAAAFLAIIFVVGLAFSVDTAADSVEKGPELLCRKALTFYI